MGVNSLPKTVIWQRHGCDLNPGPSAPESSTLTTRLPSRPINVRIVQIKTNASSVWQIQATLYYKDSFANSLWMAKLQLQWKQHDCAWHWMHSSQQQQVQFLDKFTAGQLSMLLKQYMSYHKCWYYWQNKKMPTNWLQVFKTLLLTPTWLQ